VFYWDTNFTLKLFEKQF